ncbi:hypothetical protein IFM89_030533 [Coptis chinensis]|uniref:RNase H type-1 domain-containing protein n=1 Tax=Coptis chinensis TaxID=261450 RepID=A0A835HKT6_9MAGN|nr:hypothetical protein IFM89_030533 [Coptis chinensis]
MLVQELNGIQAGLKEAEEIHVRQVIINSDSMRAVNTILGKEEVTWYCENVLQGNRRLMQTFHSVEGLKICSTRGLMKIQVGVDSKLLADWVGGKAQVPWASVNAMEMERNVWKDLILEYHWTLHP